MSARVAPALPRKMRTCEAGYSNRLAKTHVRNKYKATSTASIRYSGQWRRRLSIALKVSRSMTISLSCTTCRVVLLEIENDIGIWLRAAHKHIPGSWPLEWLGLISNRSANETSHTGMAYAGSAGPSHRNVKGFCQLKQAPELTIPRGGDPTTRK